MNKAYKLCAIMVWDGKCKRNFCILLWFGIKIVKDGCLRINFQWLRIKYICLLIGLIYHNTDNSDLIGVSVLIAFTAFFIFLWFHATKIYLLFRYIGYFLFSVIVDNHFIQIRIYIKQQNLIDIIWITLCFLLLECKVWKKGNKNHKV